jgi:hypothetical protein
MSIFFAFISTYPANRGDFEILKGQGYSFYSVYIFEA